MGAAGAEQGLARRLHVLGAGQARLVRCHCLQIATVRRAFGQRCRQCRGDGRHIQLAGDWQQRFAAFLAQHHAGVVQQRSELLLHERPLVLHHEHPAGIPARLRCERRAERPRHAHLGQAHASGAQGGAGAKAEVRQRFTHVVVRLAGGHDDKLRLGRLGHDSVDAVGGRERFGQLGFQRQPRLLGQRRVGQADVRRRRPRGCANAVSCQVNLHHAGAVRHVRRRDEACPAASEPRQRPAEQPEIQHLLHIRRGEHRNTKIPQRVLAAARQRRGLAGGIVADHQQCAPGRAGAGGVGMAQRVAGAIQARRLAVPEAEHALMAGPRKQAHLLAPPHRGGGEILVDCRLEDDSPGLQAWRQPPEFPVQAAERGAAVAGDEAGGVQAGGRVQPALVERQAGDRLDAGKVRAAALGVVASGIQAFSLRCHAASPCRTTVCGAT